MRHYSFDFLVFSFFPVSECIRPSLQGQRQKPRWEVRKTPKQPFCATGGGTRGRHSRGPAGGRAFRVPETTGDGSRFNGIYLARGAQWLLPRAPKTGGALRPLGETSSGGRGRRSRGRAGGLFLHQRNCIVHLCLIVHRHGFHEHFHSFSPGDGTGGIKFRTIEVQNPQSGQSIDGVKKTMLLRNFDKGG